MANPEHLDRLKSGAVEWNRWRSEQAGGENGLLPDLRGARLEGRKLQGMNLFRADLSGAFLEGVDLSDADLMQANLAGAELNHATLRKTRLYRANLTGAFLQRAILDRANLSSANLTGVYADGALAQGALFIDADLIETKLSGADLTGADLTIAKLINADVTGANLTRATLVETILDGTRLDNCTVYGASVWKVQTNGATQSGLIITPPDQATVTTDNLAMAQFIYMMLDNKTLRTAIETVSSKAVLILGRFLSERKTVLDAVKGKLRELDLVPVIFDWDKPTTRDLTETVTFLANMSRFVIADVTNAKSIPQELASIVPTLPSVPVQPIILQGDAGYAMFEHWRAFRTVLPVFEYSNEQHLLANVQPAILGAVHRWEAHTKRGPLELEEAIRAKDSEIERLRAVLLSRQVGE